MPEDDKRVEPEADEADVVAPSPPAQPKIGNAKRAASWVVVGAGASQVLRLAGNVALARLLEPEMFGLMALVNTFLRGLNLFSDMGIGPNIVQHERGTQPTFLRTAWTLQVMRGISLWAIMMAIAWPISEFYDSPQLLPLLAFCGASAFFGGLNSPSLFLLQKKVKVGLLTLLDLSAQVLQLIVMLIWALLSPSVWALAVGAVLSAGTKMVLSHFIKEGPRMRLQWDWKVFAELRSFGQWIFFSTAAMFLANQTDRLVLGKLLEPQMFGVYAISAVLAAMPEQILKRIGNQVIFPVLSHNKGLPREQLREKFLRSRRKLLVLLTPLVALGVVFGDVPIRLLYTEQYQAAGWMFPLLAAGMWLAVLGVSSSQVPFAFGKSSYVAAGTALRFVGIAIALPVAIHYAGILGGVCVMALAEVPVYIVTQVALHRLGMRCLTQDGLYTVFFLVGGGVCLALRNAWGFTHPLQAVLWGG